MLITFEGIDASGKTTQIDLLEKELQNRNLSFIFTRQPGGTQIGRKIRQILLDPENSELVSETEVLLYMADRIQHIKEVIQPALDRHQIVFCDRYHEATLAYQGGGRQLDLSWLEPLQEKHIIVPDRTLWFDISIEQSQERLQQRNQSQETENCRLESENVLFFKRVRAVYDQMNNNEPDRFIRVDAGRSVQEVHQQVLNIILDLIG